MNQGDRRTERLIALVALGLLAFNYPLLVLFSGERLLLGIPLLYLYLFGAWALFIGVVAYLMGRAPGETSAGRPKGPADA